jgi:hypothetical protein
MAVCTDSGNDADSDKNKTTAVTENKENETNGIIVTQREKDFSKRQEKQRNLSDDESSSEDSDNECQENKEEVARKPMLNINIPCGAVSDVENQLQNLTITHNIPCGAVSDVENQLQNLAITQSEEGKGDLCERSPMGNERQRVRSDPPYPVSYPVI